MKLIVLFVGLIFLLIIGNWKLGWQTSDKSQPSNFSLEDIIRTNPEDIKRLQEIADSEGVEKAFQYLKENYQPTYPGVHDLAHLIGILAYEERGESGSGLCDHSFGYGCYHGFFIQLFNLEGGGGIKRADEHCHSLPKQGSMASCVHGIGHGMLIVEDYELASALKVCDGLTATGQTYCHDGVFMEYNLPNTYEGLAREEVPSRTDPWYPCSSLPSRYQFACARQSLSWWNSFFKNDYEQMIAACSAAPSRDLNQGCSEAMGMLLTWGNWRNIEKLATLCAKFSSEEEEASCITAAARELVFQYQLEGKAAQLCRFIALPARREACQAAVEEMPSSYDFAHDLR